MSDPTHELTAPPRALGRCLVVAAAAYVVRVVLMTVVTALGAPEGETTVAQVADLARDDFVYASRLLPGVAADRRHGPLHGRGGAGVVAPSQGHGTTEARCARGRASPGGRLGAALRGRVRVAVHRLRLAAATRPRGPLRLVLQQRARRAVHVDLLAYAIGRVGARSSPGRSAVSGSAALDRLAAGSERRALHGRLRAARHRELPRVAGDAGERRPHRAGGSPLHRPRPGCCAARPSGRRRLPLRYAEGPRRAHRNGPPRARPHAHRRGTNARAMRASRARPAAPPRPGAQGTGERRRREDVAQVSSSRPARPRRSPRLLPRARRAAVRTRDLRPAGAGRRDRVAAPGRQAHGHVVQQGVARDAPGRGPPRPQAPRAPHRRIRRRRLVLTEDGTAHGALPRLSRRGRCRPRSRSIRSTSATPRSRSRPARRPRRTTTRLAAPASQRCERRRAGAPQRPGPSSLLVHAASAAAVFYFAAAPRDSMPAGSLGHLDGAHLELGRHCHRVALGVGELVDRGLRRSRNVMNTVPGGTLSVTVTRVVIDPRREVHAHHVALADLQSRRVLRVELGQFVRPQPLEVLRDARGDVVVVRASGRW